MYIWMCISCFGPTRPRPHRTAHSFHLRAHTHTHTHMYVSRVCGRVHVLVSVRMCARMCMCIRVGLIRR